jgi:hypothetical protein
MNTDTLTKRLPTNPFVSTCIFQDLANNQIDPGSIYVGILDNSSHWGVLISFSIGGEKRYIFGEIVMVEDKHYTLRWTLTREIKTPPIVQEKGKDYAFFSEICSDSISILAGFGTYNTSTRNCQDFAKALFRRLTDSKTPIEVRREEHICPTMETLAVDEKSSTVKTRRCCII